MTSKEKKDRIIKTQEAIKNGGFYGKNGVWNSIVTFSGDNRLYRKRVETIVIRDGKEVFVKQKPNGEYFLPGGSTEKDIPDIQQAENECNEEARLNVKNIMSTGITYKVLKEAKWAKNQDFEINWQGYVTDVYIAEYDSKFTGHIDDCDKDPFIMSGKWVSTSKCFSFFRKEHRDALLWYIKSKNEEKEEAKLISESYVSNYFKNKRLIKRISKDPELGKKEVDQLLSMITKAYRELNSKSKIQREKKSPDVADTFYPVATFDFSDANTITVALCFDEKSETPGAAVSTEESGDIVVIYPKFFKESKAVQIFVLLHEIGHIRLNHLNEWNVHRNILMQDNTQSYRQRLASKGKVMYPELNADLYAIINGANLYAILDMSEKRDFDKTYDYRYVNMELSNRYNKALIRSNRLLPQFESNFTHYDIACLAVHELVYENEKTSSLSKQEKRHLYQIMRELCIDKPSKAQVITENGDSTISKEEAVQMGFEKIYQEKYNINESKEKVLSLIEEKENFKKSFLNDMKIFYENGAIRYVNFGVRKNNFKYYLKLMNTIL